MSGGRSFALLAVVVTAWVATACSSSAAQPAATPSPTPGVSTPEVVVTDVPATPTPTPDPVNTFQSIGSFMVSSKNETVTTNISASQPLLNTVAKPPEAVLDACQWHYASTIAASMYIHGSLTVQYSGALQVPVFIDTSSPITELASSNQFGAGQVGGVAINDPEGDWHCPGAANGWSRNFPPGASVTVEWWADLSVLSNAHPQFTAEEQAALALTLHGTGADQVLNGTVTAQGPGAAKCDGSLLLLLYNKPPYAYDAKDISGYSHPYTCVAP